MDTIRAWKLDRSVRVAARMNRERGKGRLKKEKASSSLLSKRTTQIHALEMLILAGSIIAPPANLVRANRFGGVDLVTICQRPISTTYPGDKVGMVAIGMEAF